LKTIWEFLGNVFKAQATIQEYDQKTMLTMLLHVYFHLNHVNVQVGRIINHKEEDFFGQDVSNDDVIFFYYEK
jgi:hypothetical protein